MVKRAILVAKNVCPIHEHDCPMCRFLGRLDGKDLYRCQTGDLVARFGSEPAEYGSLGDLAPEGTPYALAAKLAAIGGVPRAYQTAIT